MTDGIINIKDTAEAVKGIVEAVPVYEDMLQPAAKELGKGLHTVSKAVNMALAPIAGLVWCYERIENYLNASAGEKLKDVPEENIISPEPSIVVPAIEALRYTAQNEELRNMFSNLISNAMDKRTASFVHPSFVEILKQINSDEAKILGHIKTLAVIPVIDVRGIVKDKPERFLSLLKDFSLLPYSANCDFPDNGPSYLTNLVRLGLISIDYTSHHIVTEDYITLSNHPRVTDSQNSIDLNEYNTEIVKGVIRRTSFGTLFYETCVADK